MGRNALVHQAMYDAVIEKFPRSNSRDVDILNVCSKAMDDFACITLLEYSRLKIDSESLSQLYAAGVDNWDGYEDAFEE